MTLNELMDSIRDANGLTSDAQIAQKLELDKRRVSAYRNGKETPDEFACLKIAEALGKPLDSIIATVKAATEKDEKRREVWENYIKRLGGFAASFALVVFLAVTTVVTSPMAEAAPLLAFDKFAGYAICIM